MSQGDVGKVFREWTKAQAAAFGSSASELAELDTLVEVLRDLRNAGGRSACERVV